MLCYQHLNLSNNPFGEMDTDQRVQLAEVNLDLIAEQLKRVCNTHDDILHITGQHGRGKTIYLQVMHEYYNHNYHQAPYIQVTYGQKRKLDFAKLISLKADKSAEYCANSTPCFIDNLENLTVLQRLVVYHKFPKLVVTSARNLTPEMALLGKQVSTLTISTDDPTHLLNAFNQRITYFRRNNTAVPVLSLADIKTLQQAFDDDIRAIESALYLCFEALDELRLPFHCLSPTLVDIIQANATKLSSTTAITKSKQNNKGGLIDRYF